MLPKWSLATSFIRLYAVQTTVFCSLEEEEEEEEFIFHIITNNMQCNYYKLI